MWRGYFKATRWGAAANLVLRMPRHTSARWASLRIPLPPTFLVNQMMARFQVLAQLHGISLTQDDTGGSHAGSSSSEPVQAAGKQPHAVDPPTAPQYGSEDSSAPGPADLHSTRRDLAADLQVSATEASPQAVVDEPGAAAGPPSTSTSPCDAASKRGAGSATLSGARPGAQLDFFNNADNFAALITAAASAATTAAAAALHGTWQQPQLRGHHHRHHRHRSDQQHGGGGERWHRRGWGEEGRRGGLSGSSSSSPEPEPQRPAPRHMPYTRQQVGRARYAAVCQCAHAATCVPILRGIPNS